MPGFSFFCNFLIAIFSHLVYNLSKIRKSDTFSLIIAAVSPFFAVNSRRQCLDFQFFSNIHEFP